MLSVDRPRLSDVQNHLSHHPDVRLVHATRKPSSEYLNTPTRQYPVKTVEDAQLYVVPKKPVQNQIELDEIVRGIMRPSNLGPYSHWLADRLMSDPAFQETGEMLIAGKMFSVSHVSYSELVAIYEYPKWRVYDHEATQRYELFGQRPELPFVEYHRRVNIPVYPDAVFVELIQMFEQFKRYGDEQFPGHRGEMGRMFTAVGEEIVQLWRNGEDVIGHYFTPDGQFREDDHRTPLISPRSIRSRSIVTPPPVPTVLEVQPEVSYEGATLFPKGVQRLSPQLEETLDSAQLRDQIIQLRNQGFGNISIAQHLDKPLGQINTIVSSLIRSKHIPYLRTRSENNNRRTREERQSLDDQIRELIAYKPKEIATRLGITVSNVNNSLTRIKNSTSV